MTDTTRDELLQLTRALLDSIAQGDWPTYERLCDPTLSAFEPEACGHLVEGLAFHKYYFDLPRSQDRSVQTTLTAPHVRQLGPDVAIVCYSRLVQHATGSGPAQIACSQETRVWQRQNGQWRHVHFHRTN
jgi:calcium/calmodulin-dependent protein kinase (CaM kinase) II